LLSASETNIVADMETDGGRASDDHACDNLAAAERAGTAMVERLRTPWPFRAPLAVAIGVLLFLRSLPSGWEPLRSNLELACLLVIVATLIATRVWMSVRGARRRVWGGPAWLAAGVVCALPALALLVWPEPETHGFRPVVAALTVVAVVVVAIGDEVTERLWFRYWTRA
jgi:hypothetical protein